MGSVYDNTVAAIIEQLQVARWTNEATLVIASTGKLSGRELVSEDNLTAAGFRLIAEAPNMRHEYNSEEPNRHHVKLWVCDVTNIAKPEVVPPQAGDFKRYAPGMRV